MPENPRLTPARMVRAHEPMLKTAPKLLRAPIMLVCPQGEVRLSRGALTIGRHIEADLRLEDVLVSRLHARISVQEDGSILVEDLHSRNGVYVNGARLARGSERLREGDRLLIGTFEIGAFTASPDRPAQPVAVAKLNVQRRIDTADPPPTDRAEGLILLARYAERLAREGRPEEAVRALSEQLNRVLLGAGAGLQFTPNLLDHASEYAIKLFGWSQNRAWVEYVLELHVAAGIAPSESCTALLEATLASGRVVFDPALSRYFLEFVTSSSADSARKRRLRALLASDS